MSFHFLFEFVGAVMSSLYDIRPSYGFMIIGATLIALVFTTPLTFKTTRSMLVMQRLQPELRKLQARYRNDRQRLTEELHLFHREHGVNPLGGCLPLLVQMPVFAVLSGVLHGLVRRTPDAGSSVGWIVGHRALGGGSAPHAPALVRTFDPLYLPPGRLLDDLHASSSLQWFGMNLADSFQTALTERGLMTSLPYLALVAFVAATGIWQQRQTRSPSGSSPADRQQEVIAKIMPLVLPLMSFTFPAGLVLYLAVSNLYRLGQNVIIARTLAAPGSTAPADDDRPGRRRS
jgi:YidC/Oxa1 family membrane protein insertase